MIPREAFEKAMEAGWWPKKYARGGRAGDDRTPTQSIHSWCQIMWKEYTIDPSFWQALGTALGWDRYQFTPVEFIRKHPSGAVTTEFKTPIDEWHQAALLFCSMILGEKNTDAFWKELLDK